MLGSEDVRDAGAGWEMKGRYDGMRKFICVYVRVWIEREMNMCLNVCLRVRIVDFSIGIITVGRNNVNSHHNDGNNYIDNNHHTIPDTRTDTRTAHPPSFHTRIYPPTHIPTHPHTPSTHTHTPKIDVIQVVPRGNAIYEKYIIRENNRKLGSEG